MRTRAEDTGSGFKINGQKIWTSYAAHAEHCFLMARTNPDAPRHKGISMFLVDMDTPGITVRPIESMSGPIEFHEVFFDDAEVPYDALLGPRDQGWKVAMSALEGERAGVGYAGLYGSQLDQLLRFAKESQDGTGRRVSERPDAQGKLVRLRALNRALRLLMYKVVANQTVDDSVLVESAIYKTLAGDMSMQIAQLAMEVTGSRRISAGTRPHGDAGRRRLCMVDSRAASADCCGVKRDPAQHHRPAWSGHSQRLATMEFWF